MSELKPCPFCGCGDIGMSSDLSGEWAHCFCQAMDGRSVHKEQWSRRPLEEALEAQVKELEADLEFARLSINGAIGEAEKYIYDITDQQEYDPEQYGINLVQILVGYFEEKIAQAKATVVQWVTYDGTPETLPEECNWVLVARPEHAPWPTQLDCSRGFPEWGTFEWPGDSVFPISVHPGDCWAYLPTPPEARS